MKEDLIKKRAHTCPERDVTVADSFFNETGLQRSTLYLPHRWSLFLEVLDCKALPASLPDGPRITLKSDTVIESLSAHAESSKL